MATIGQLGNLDHENVTYGKAGRTRWHGKRPTVRGVAMNPVDHPHGGGEGRVKGNHPQTPWGFPDSGREDAQEAQERPDDCGTAQAVVWSSSSKSVKPGAAGNRESVWQLHDRLDVRHADSARAARKRLPRRPPSRRRSRR